MAQLNEAQRSSVEFFVFTAFFLVLTRVVFIGQPCLISLAILKKHVRSFVWI